MTDRATREWQAALARRSGIYGFCYYHYWFKGKQLLEAPVDALIRDGTPEFPFCLAWANETWTRVWDGGDDKVLIQQEYGTQGDWDRHFARLLHAFLDPRYIRVDGRPLFLIYRTAAITSMPDMLARWRELALEAGLPGLHIVSMLTGFPADDRVELFDSRAEFEPMHTIHHHLSRSYRWKEKWIRQCAKVRRYFVRDSRPHKLNGHDYATLWKWIARRTLGANIYPGGFADWDSTARRGLGALVLRNFDRAAFRSGLAAQLQKARECNAPFLFFNAWNEWAEGTYLEPDNDNHMFFLDTIEQLTRPGGDSPVPLARMPEVLVDHSE